MTCDETVEALAPMEPGEAPSPEVREHLLECEACRRKAEGFSSLDALARRALPLRRRFPVFRWAAAAALLATAGLAFHAWKPKPRPAPPASEPRREAFLERDGDAVLNGRTLVLRSGACWLDTKVPVEMTDPAKVRFEAGTEAEVRLLRTTRVSLWTEAWAGEAPEVLVSVVSGCAWHGSLRIPSGMRARLPAGVLEPLDPAPIDAWRSRRTGEKSFTAEVKNVTGNLVLSYPAGETLLGDLPAFRDGAWHRISVTWRGSSTEIFLDGRRISKLPAADGSGSPGISVRCGTMERRP